VSAPDAPHAVTDAAAAAFLVDPVCRRFLEPFLGRDCTVAQASRELGEAPNTVLYRVRQMLRVGLLIVVRTEPRRGRAVKVYRSVADALFVPYAATPAVDLMDVMRRERAAQEETLLRALLRVMRFTGDDAAWGMVMYRRGEGVYAYDAVQGAPPSEWLEPDDPAVLDYSFVVGGWSRAQAKAFQQDLRAVLARHSKAQGPPSSVRYLVRIALAPLEPDS